MRDFYEEMGFNTIPFLASSGGVVVYASMSSFFRFNFQGQGVAPVRSARLKMRLF